MTSRDVNFDSRQADPQSNLLANSMDFIYSAAEFASRDESRSWKYAVLHLWYGMELLLKARLAQEHWSLLFWNVDQADKSKLFEGDFRSVDSEQAYRRLYQVCGVQLDEDDWKYLVQLRNRSNRIRHHVGEYNSMQVKSMVWKCVNIAITFCQSQGLLEESRMVREYVYEINTLLQEFDDYLDERLRSISSHPDFSPGVECRGCWQEASTMDHTGIKCQFCGMEIDADTLNQWIADLRDGTVDEGYDW